MLAQSPFDRRDLMEWLHYDKHTGALTWRVNRSRLAKAGDDAGAYSHGVVLVGINGRTFTAAQLIYWYVTGNWPHGRLRFRDGDGSNLRWNNIMEEQNNLSQRHINVYQRYRRKLRKLVLKRVADDPVMQAYYASLSLPAAKAYMHQLMQKAAEDVARDRVRLHGNDEEFSTLHFATKETKEADKNA